MKDRSYRRKLLLGGLGGASILALPRMAASATYPDRPVKIMVGYPPGQSTDTLTRMWAQELARSMGQPFVVDNRAGAGGIIAATTVAHSPADGYTLLGGSGAMAIWPYAYPQLKLDVAEEFAYICRTVTVPVVLVASNDFQAKDFKHFLKLGLQSSGDVNYGSGGVGITSHLAMEMLMSMAGLKLTHIPYKGTPAALNDLFGGRLNVMFDVTTTLLPHIAAGKCRPLAVASKERLPELPDVPTIAESGFPGFEALTWGLLAAPASTPKDTVQRLSTEMQRILNHPATTSRLATMGVSAGWMSSEDTSAYLKSEAAKWGKIIKEANIKFE